MMTSKISIAMATYNGERYLPQLLESLSNQNVRADEIIVVDDCSSDGTIDVLKSYSKKLPIRIYANETNLGVNRNFEKAVSLTTGDCILLCDQDDVWLPFNIEKKIKALNAMPQNEPAFVASRSIMVDSELKELISFGTSKDVFDPIDVFFTPFQGTTLAFNRTFADAVRGWPESFREFPYDGYLRFFAVLIANLHALAKPLMLYRCHENNVELSVNRKLQFFKRTWLTLLLQYCLTPLRLKRLGFVLKKAETWHIKKERLNIFKDLESCLKENRVSWLGFWTLQSVPCRVKMRAFLASMLSFARKNSLTLKSLANN